MKAKLTFNLNDAEDRKAHLRAVKADDMYNVMWDVRQYIRQIEKYDKKFSVEEIKEIINEIDWEELE
jgi:CHASE3 domain sensor protein